MDSKFNLCSSKIVEFNLRESLLIDIDEEFKEEENYKFGSYFICIQINKRLPKNHGSNTWTARGGINRFWGIWNESSSFNHSRYIPHPTKFIRNNLKIQQGKFLERLNYSKAAKKIVHYGPFSNNKLIEGRGDLSGKLRLEPGYTIYFDEFNKVKAAFHQNYPFNSRFLRQKNFHPFIKHVIAIPPIKEIDIEMFFGECCSNESKFKVEIHQYTQSKEIISSSKIISIKNVDNSVNLSQIFPKKEISGLGGWITFEAMDGKHDKKFINHIYKTFNKEMVFDSVHSHNFSKGFHKYGSRTLKFAPFHNKLIKNKNNSIESWIAIFGNEERDISTRIRLFNHNDCSF